MQHEGPVTDDKHKASGNNFLSIYSTVVACGITVYNVGVTKPTEDHVIIFPSAGLAGTDRRLPPFPDCRHAGVDDSRRRENKWAPTETDP